MPNPLHLLLRLALPIAHADTRFDLEEMEEQVKQLLGRILMESTREVYHQAMERVRRGENIDDLVPIGHGIVSLHQFLTRCALAHLLRGCCSHSLID